MKVASGAIPEFVTSQDIPSPISFEEAHARYATSVAAFITVQSQQLFTDEEVRISNQHALNTDNVSIQIIIR